MGEISVEEFNNMLTNFYNSLNIGGLKIFLIIYLILLYLVFSISLVYILKKEKVTWYYALIPLYNVYVYMKILDINWIYAFIPVINIAIFFSANYILARAYGQKRIICILTVVFPIVLIPYIAFNKNITRFHYMKPKPFLRHVKDVDELEKRLEDNPDNQDLYDIKAPAFLKKQEAYVSNIEKKIDTIEENAIKEDYSEQLYQNELDYQTVEKKPDEIPVLNDQEDIVDIFESNDIRAIGIDKKVEEIENAAQNVKVVDTSNYQEYKQVGPEDSTIAFGGIEVNKKVGENITEAKTEELKCPYCKSSLVNAVNNTCPGCGHDISNIINEKNSA